MIDPGITCLLVSMTFLLKVLVGRKQANMWWIFDQFGSERYKYRQPREVPYGLLRQRHLITLS